MSGTLGLGTPWTRALFPGDKRAEAEALIPDGFQINVSAVNGRPGPWHVTGLRCLEGARPVVVLEWTSYSPHISVPLMAQRLADMAVRVESWTLADDMSVTVAVDYTEGVA